MRCVTGIQLIVFFNRLFARSRLCTLQTFYQLLSVGRLSVHVCEVTCQYRWGGHPLPEDDSNTPVLNPRKDHQYPD